MFVTKGGVGYGVDETQKVEDDGKGWVWIAAEMSPGGLALELLKSVPYGKRAILVAKQNNVDDVSDADIESFYAELTSGSGGDPAKGNVVAELIVKFFHGEFTPQGFKRYSGLWKGPPPGTVGKKDIAVGMASLMEQMKSPMFVTKGGVGYGVDETQKSRTMAKVGCGLRLR